MTTKINKELCGTLRKEMENDLAALAKKYGFKVKVGNAKYTDSYVNFAMTLSVIDDTGVAKTPELVALEKLYPQYVGKTISRDGKTYAVVGYDSRSYRYPFQVKCSITGKVYKMNSSMVKDGLKKNDILQ